MGLFNRDSNKTAVWFMRQAGRYHTHYQALRKKHDFNELCKNPELASEVTMGPINDFGFDAAILFSDLLFPLEQLGLGLSYATGKPTLEKQLLSIDDVQNLKLKAPASEFYNFQKTACELLREKLPASKNLIGFVGAPFTLFTYAVHGTHAGNLLSAKVGLHDKRFDCFSEMLLPETIKEMKLQAQGGADTVAIFDTAVGELSLVDFKEKIIPLLSRMSSEFKKDFPDKKIIYYSKHATMDHLLAIEDENIDVLGIDYRFDLVNAFQKLGDDYILQGNIDPCWLHLPWEQLESKLNTFLTTIDKSNISLDRWICGLGHGVLVGTPEENVRQSVDYIHNFFK